MGVVEENRMNVRKLASGRVYRCPVCGAELTVIYPGTGCLGAICCNRPMELLGRVSPIYRCPLCGAELTVINQGSTARLGPICCNRPMERRKAA